jgi:endogenous inhibitor of DNA gyrase (YacG/DUF329 family)
MKCLECSNEYAVQEPSFSPFCSERCKMVDLGKWLGETYTIADADYSALGHLGEIDDDLAD